MAWKYVILRVGNTEVPVIFPDRMVHAWVAGLVKAYFAQEIKFAHPQIPDAALTEAFTKFTVVSAGEANIAVISASGHSGTLGAPSRPGDKDFLNSYPYTGGYVDEDEE